MKIMKQKFQMKTKSKITASYLENNKKTDLKELIDSDLQQRIHAAVLRIQNQSNIKDLEDY